jgi:Family of unknown function (DUF5994)
MMTTLPAPTTATGALGGPRLRLEPTRSRHTILDGAWWPYSTNLLSELPALVLLLDARRGPITHLMLGDAAAAEHPRRLTVNGRRIRLGWFTSQSAALLIAISGNWERTDLLVIPPAQTPESADQAMTAAAEAPNTLRAPDLLAAVTTPWRTPDVSAHTAWESEGGRLTSS